MTRNSGQFNVKLRDVSAFTISGIYELSIVVDVGIGINEIDIHVVSVNFWWTFTTGNNISIVEDTESYSNHLWMKL